MSILKKIVKELGRTPGNVKKIVTQDLPSVILAPTLIPSVWLAEALVEKVDSDLGQKLSSKRRELAQAILCGPGEDGAECRRKLREGVQPDASEMNVEMSQEQFAQWIDVHYDGINVAYSSVAQSVSDPTTELDALEKVLAQAKECLEVVQQAATTAKDKGLVVPDAYEKLAERSGRLVEMMEEDIEAFRSDQEAV